MSVGNVTRECVGHGAAINAVRFTIDGSFCMTASDDKNICLWNPHKDDPSKSQGLSLLIKQYSGAHSYPIYDLAISHDNTKFMSAGSDRVFFQWDVVHGKVVKRISGHSQKINSVVMNSESTVAITGSNDQTACIWDLRSNMRDPIQTLSDSKDSVTCVLCNESKIFTASVDGCRRSYDIRMGKVFADNLIDPIVSMSLSHDKKSIISVCLSNPTGIVNLTEESSGTLLQQFKGHHINQSYKSEACMTASDYRHPTKTTTTSSMLAPSPLVACGSEDGNVCYYRYLDGVYTGKTDLQLSGNASKRIIPSIVSHPKLPLILAATAAGTLKCITL